MEIKMKDRRARYEDKINKLRQRFIDGNATRDDYGYARMESYKIKLAHQCKLYWYLKENLNA